VFRAERIVSAVRSHLLRRRKAPSNPIIGLQGLLGLLEIVGKLKAAHLLEREEDPAYPKEPFPPPLTGDESTPLWLKLPPANRKRLLWLMGQLLQRQLEGITTTTTLPKGDGHDPERRS
jgi:hypothetical protein